jgi:hypothetical protein
MKGKIIQPSSSHHFAPHHFAPTPGRVWLEVADSFRYADPQRAARPRASCAQNTHSVIAKNRSEDRSPDAGKLGALAGDLFATA